MRVATVDGLVTLFYDGSKELYNQDLQYELTERFLVEGGDARRANLVETLNLSNECKEYFRERLSWQQVIVVHGVNEIPDCTFYECHNIKRVIFADTVIRIGVWAFYNCKNLVYIEWSLLLQYIGECAFGHCDLSSVFIPPGCRQIGNFAFNGNSNLTILNIPPTTELGNEIIDPTKLLQSCPFVESEDINTWIKNINLDDQFDLHRVCSSFEPTLQMILATMEAKGGPNAFKVENIIGITPSQYLKENPYVDITEKDIIKKYVLQMTGEL